MKAATLLVLLFYFCSLPTNFVSGLILPHLTKLMLAQRQRKAQGTMGIVSPRRIKIPFQQV